MRSDPNSGTCILEGMFMYLNNGLVIFENRKHTAISPAKESATSNSIRRVQINSPNKQRANNETQDWGTLGRKIISDDLSKLLVFEE